MYSKTVNRHSIFILFGFVLASIFTLLFIRNVVGVLAQTPTTPPITPPVVTGTPTPTAIHSPTPTLTPETGNWSFIVQVIDKSTSKGVAGAKVSLYYSDQWSPIPGIFDKSIKGPIATCTSVTVGGPFKEQGYCNLKSSYHPYFFIRKTSNPVGFTSFSAAAICTYSLRPCKTPIPGTTVFSPENIRRYFGHSGTQGTYVGNIFFINK